MTQEVKTPAFFIVNQYQSSISNHKEICYDKKMLRGFSFVSTRYFDRNNTLTYGQPGELVREPVKTSIDSLATNQYLLSLLHKKDNELTETEKEYINLCYKETLENLDKETWEKILTSTEEISGIEKFNNAILELNKIAARWPAKAVAQFFYFF